MKNFCIGLALGLSLTCNIAQAVVADLSEFTTRDLYAAALMGAIGPLYLTETSVKLCFDKADLAMRLRHGK